MVTAYTGEISVSDCLEAAGEMWDTYSFKRLSPKSRGYQWCVERPLYMSIRDKKKKQVSASADFMALWSRSQKNRGILNPEMPLSAVPSRG